MIPEYQLAILLSKPYLDKKEKNFINQLINQNLNWSIIFKELRRHRISAIAYQHLATAELKDVIPNEFCTALKTEFEKNKSLQELYRSECIPFLKALQKNNIPFCLLKGVVLQELLYPKYTRIYKDIDILIQKNSYTDVSRILNLYGFSNEQNMCNVKRKRERIFLLLNTYEFPEFKKEIIKNGCNNYVNVDVQHSHALSSKMGYHVNNTDEIVTSQNISIDGEQFKCQNLQYLLIHLCTHAFGDAVTISEIILNKAFRLRNFGDIVGIVEKFSDSYLSDKFYDLVSKTNTIKPVYFCLYYCTQIYQVSDSFKQIVKNLEKQLTDYSFLNQYGFENGSSGVFNWKCNLENKLFSEESIIEVKKKAKNDIEKYANYDTRINI